MTAERDIEVLSPDDERHLERARDLGRRGWGWVHPNPMVGCVLVRDGVVVGEGHHQEFGGPHAEIEALHEAGPLAEGATAYVSLEPCDHQGKTAPCSQALLRAGVARVVYGARDPGADSGGGAETLAAAGVEVVGPVWPDRVARAENGAFFHAGDDDGPYVVLKLAMSLDARIAADPGRPSRITGPEAEREVHTMRSGFDAVMVGAGTARADDPRLTVRLAPPGRVPPRRVVLVSGADLRLDAALFHDAGSVPLHLFVAEDADEGAVEVLEEAGAHVHPVPRANAGLDLGAVLGACWTIGIRSILCEGGAELAATLLREERVHRACFFVAPVTIGGGGLPAFPDDAGALSWSAFAPVAPPRLLGDDVLIVLDRQEG